MKKIFILLVVGLFVAYCFASVRYYSYVSIPTYSNVTVDIMKGMAVTAWDRDPTAQRERFRDLERKNYQPPVAGWHFSSGLSYSPTHILTGDDFRKILDQEPKLARSLEVRDPAAITALSALGYRLRDIVMIPGENGDLAFALKAGANVDKAVIDRCLSAGIVELRVIGKGSMVSPELGTMIMIIMIFLGLLCALDLVLYKPLISMVDQRNGEIEAGMAQVRFNRVESQRLLNEAEVKRKELRRNHMSLLAKYRHEVMKEADQILKHANVEAHRLRDNAHLEMKKVVREAEDALRLEVDTIAQEIVSKILNTAGGRNE